MMKVFLQGTDVQARTCHAGCIHNLREHAVQLAALSSQLPRIAMSCCSVSAAVHAHHSHESCVCHMVDGRCKRSQGRPVLIVLAARHDMSLRNLSETEQLIVYTLDNTAAAADLTLNPVGQFLCLFDLSGAALLACAGGYGAGQAASSLLVRSLRPVCLQRPFHFDRSSASPQRPTSKPPHASAGITMNNLDVQALRRIFDLLQTHFPERLSELWFLNAPWIFWGAP